MTAIPAFYGFPHHTLQAVEVTIARVQVWADARKWIAQGLTVVYRGDLEG